MGKTKNKTTSANGKSATIKTSKTRLIIIVVAIIAIAAGGYWYYGRYKQQKFIKDYIKMMGLENSPYAAAIAQQMGGQIPTSGGLADLLKQFGGTSGDTTTEPEKEKTPAENFAVAKEVKVPASATVAVSEASGVINGVFGKSKVTSASSGAMGMSGVMGVDFITPRAITAEDGEALVAAFVALGYQEFSTANDEGKFSASMMKGDNPLSLTFEFDTGGQEINIIKYDFSDEAPGD